MRLVAWLPPPLDLEAGIWSLQPHPGGFLLGKARGIRSRLVAWLPPPLDLEAGVWSLQPHPGGFLLGRARGVIASRRVDCTPPWRSPWRLSSPILPRLGAPVRHLGTKMPQHLPRYPKKHHLGANIFQHSSQNPPKTASRPLQRQLQTLKKIDSDGARVFLLFGHFSTRKKEPKMLPGLPFCCHANKATCLSRGPN